MSSRNIPGISTHSNAKNYLIQDTSSWFLVLGSYPPAAWRAESGEWRAESGGQGGGRNAVRRRPGGVERGAQSAERRGQRRRSEVGISEGGGDIFSF